MKDPPKERPRTPGTETRAGSSTDPWRRKKECRYPLGHISHLSISTPEPVNVLRQMGQQVKWPKKMKGPDSFRNPGLWCDFHRDHGHKTEDCVALRIEVNEQLQKGHLREFLSEKDKNHLNKEVPAKSAGAIPSSPPRQDRVIHVISGGSEISGVSHAATKKSTRNAKHGLETTKPKRFLIGTDKISFTAKEQEKILAPHHDALVISLTVANCLVKKILVDNDISSNIIFQTAYQDLGLEESALTRKINPLIGFSSKVKQTAGEGPEVKRSGGWRSIQRTRTPNHMKDHLRTGIDRFAWSHSRSSKAVPVQKTGTSQDPHPPPLMDLASYQPMVSQLKKRGISNVRRPPLKSYQKDLGQRVPCQRRTKIPSQARVLQTWSFRWMNATTHLMTVLRTFITRKHWLRIPNSKRIYRSWGTRQISVMVPGHKGEAVPSNGERDDAPRKHSYNPQQTGIKSTSQEESNRWVQRTQRTGPDHGVPPGTTTRKRNPPAGALIQIAKQSQRAT
ncbi:hypothetical protein F2Q69_00029720 [Brassica cretica]|uniref:Uncharacterized protein n=1 Tax=Brassica cretica TaxID=69181 RepID=A0A8S9S0V5_BRACR|nr:hypothetical protein F2Q69_00029720 [Brassica cretica]